MLLPPLPPCPYLRWLEGLRWLQSLAELQDLLVPLLLPDLELDLLLVPARGSVQLLLRHLPLLLQSPLQPLGLLRVLPLAVLSWTCSWRPTKRNGVLGSRLPNM